jgi:hypothetical protein
MKNAIIDEIVKPLDDILNYHLKDVNGNDIDNKYLGHAQAKLLSSVADATKIIRKDLDTLFDDMFEPDDVYYYNYMKKGDD